MTNSNNRGGLMSSIQHLFSSSKGKNGEDSLETEKIQGSDNSNVVEGEGKVQENHEDDRVTGESSVSQQEPRQEEITEISSKKNVDIDKNHLRDDTKPRSSITKSTDTSKKLGVINHQSGSITSKPSFVSPEQILGTQNTTKPDNSASKDKVLKSPRKNRWGKRLVTEDLKTDLPIHSNEILFSSELNSTQDSSLPKTNPKSKSLKIDTSDEQEKPNVSSAKSSDDNQNNHPRKKITKRRTSPRTQSQDVAHDYKSLDEEDEQSVRRRSSRHRDQAESFVRRSNRKRNMPDRIYYKDLANSVDDEYDASILSVGTQDLSENGTPSPKKMRNSPRDQVSKSTKHTMKTVKDEDLSDDSKDNQDKKIGKSTKKKKHRKKKNSHSPNALKNIFTYLDYDDEDAAGDRDEDEEESLYEDESDYSSTSEEEDESISDEKQQLKGKWISSKQSMKKAELKRKQSHIQKINSSDSDASNDTSQVSIQSKEGQKQKRKRLQILPKRDGKVELVKSSSRSDSDDVTDEASSTPKKNKGRESSRKDLRREKNKPPQINSQSKSNDPNLDQADDVSILTKTVQERQKKRGRSVTKDKNSNTEEDEDDNSTNTPIMKASQQNTNAIISPNKISYNTPSSWVRRSTRKRPRNSEDNYTEQEEEDMSQDLEGGGRGSKDPEKILIFLTEKISVLEAKNKELSLRLQQKEQIQEERIQESDIPIIENTNLTDVKDGPSTRTSCDAQQDDEKIIHTSAPGDEGPNGAVAGGRKVVEESLLHLPDAKDSEIEIKAPEKVGNTTSDRRVQLDLNIFEDFKAQLQEAMDKGKSSGEEGTAREEGVDMDIAVVQKFRSQLQDVQEKVKASPEATPEQKKTYISIAEEFRAQLQEAIDKEKLQDDKKSQEIADAEKQPMNSEEVTIEEEQVKDKEDVDLDEDAKSLTKKVIGDTVEDGNEMESLQDTKPADAISELSESKEQKETEKDIGNPLPNEDMAENFTETDEGTKPNNKEAISNLHDQLEKEKQKNKEMEMTHYQRLIEISRLLNNDAAKNKRIIEDLKVQLQHEKDKKSQVNKTLQQYSEEFDDITAKSQGSKNDSMEEIVSDQSNISLSSEEEKDKHHTSAQCIQGDSSGENLNNEDIIDETNSEASTVKASPHTSDHYRRKTIQGELNKAQAKIKRIKSKLEHERQQHSAVLVSLAQARQLNTQLQEKISFFDRSMVDLQMQNQKLRREGRELEMILHRKIEALDDRDQTIKELNVEIIRNVVMYEDALNAEEITRIITPQSSQLEVVEETTMYPIAESSVGYTGKKRGRPKAKEGKISGNKKRRGRPKGSKTRSKT